MHLWPSMRIRESFKLSYLTKLEWNLQRMNSEKKRQSQSSDQEQTQRLLVDNQRNVVVGEVSETPRSKDPPFRFASVCKEILLLISCCYCCFCCGACVDQEGC